MLTDRVAELTLEKGQDAVNFNNIIAKTKYRLVENLLDRKTPQLAQSPLAAHSPDV